MLAIALFALALLLAFSLLPRLAAVGLPARLADDGPGRRANRSLVALGAITLSARCSRSCCCEWPL